VQDGPFVGVAAPTAFLAEHALDAISATAKWDAGAGISSTGLFEHLDRNAKQVPANPFAAELASAAQVLKQTYTVAYAQHAPLEPRAACAAWDPGGSLTVWTGTQNPFGVRGELARAFGLDDAKVRVIVPDFGGGFGGKHTGEAAVEAARLARAAGKPVALRWTRQEEFTWAYFRPAAVIHAQAGLDAQGAITSWHFVNINSGGSALETPYRIAKAASQFVNSDPPLRQGSYRSLAATANTFARESMMDELAHAAGRDPLEFRLAHLDNARPDNARLKAVLQDAAQRFDWATQVKKKAPKLGIGLACGTDKGSFIAACVEVLIEKSAITVRRVFLTFECGAITNPRNLLSQVQGATTMGLGPALREAIAFDNGAVTNASFLTYRVPRFADTPQFDVRLLDRPDIPSARAGETPIIAIAPAIANAVFYATGERIRGMPITL
jgi:isoquinoline 1-oxidoreductase